MLEIVKTSGEDPRMVEVAAEGLPEAESAATRAVPKLVQMI